TRRGAPQRPRRATRRAITGAQHGRPGGGARLPTRPTVEGGEPSHTTRVHVFHRADAHREGACARPPDAGSASELRPRGGAPGAAATGFRRPSATGRRARRRTTLKERELSRDLSRLIRGELTSAYVKRMAQRAGFQSFAELCESELPEELDRIEISTRDIVT